MTLMWIRLHTTRLPFLSRHEIADRREDECHIRKFVRFLVRIASLDGAERAGTTLGCGITGAGESQEGRLCQVQT